jgi:hypothetical protein
MVRLIGQFHIRRVDEATIVANIDNSRSRMDNVSAFVAAMGGLLRVARSG